MKNPSVIRQLEGLRQESILMAEISDDPQVWEDDNIALTKVIRMLERKEARRNDITLKVSAFICTVIMIGSIFLMIGLVGDVELTDISKQETIFKAIVYLALMYASYVGLRLMWLGVGNE